MAKFLKNRSVNRGTAPGEATFIGRRKMDKVVFQAMIYDKDSLLEIAVNGIEEFQKCIESGKIAWLNIYGLHDTALLKEMGERFSIHPLLVEDIANTDQRPRYEEDDKTIVTIIKFLKLRENESSICADQLSLVLGDRVLVTMQEKPGQYFEDVRNRLRNNIGRIRRMGADYLMYALLDAVVDQYLGTVTDLGDIIDKKEEQLLKNPDEGLSRELYMLKTEVGFLRKNIRPVKEIALRLVRSENNLLTDEIQPFLLDLDDLITQTLEAVELYHSVVSDQLNMYNSIIGNRTNDIMKTLTIYAAIFIPLTFLAGIYGTNFDFLPELHFKYSYFIMWGIMIAVALLMIRYFRKKRWM